MQDLRDEKTINKEEGIVKPHKEADKWTTINAVFLKIYMRGLFIVKSYKFFWISIIIILIALYPIELGDFIGNWINLFYSNLMKNFK